MLKYWGIHRDGGRGQGRRPAVDQSEQTRAVFAAIVDPTRRALVDLLAQQGELPVQTLAADFDVTLSAISQHLKVLREAGLVSERRDGRQRLYRLNPEALTPVMDWVMQHTERFWRQRLGALGEYLDTQHDGPADPAGSTKERKR